MIKIYKLTIGKNPHYQHYTVKSRKGYTIITRYKGKNVWAKIITDLPPLPPPEPPIPEGNVIVKVFLKDDYGNTGHKIWFDCWVTRTFSISEKLEIKRWIDATKKYMRDRIAGYGNMHLLSGYIYGIEFDEIRDSTMNKTGIQEEHFEYSHDNKHWFKIP